MIQKKEFDIKCLSDFEYNWDCAKYYTSIIDSSEARIFLINILENWECVNEESKSIWLDLIERAGFYPYYINKSKNVKGYERSLQASIRSVYFKSEYLDNIYFHEKQKEIERALSMNKNIAVSAPTSFGKSILIEEFVARKCYDNILIIQPTLALIDETRKNLSKYLDYYNIVINTNQTVLDKNIFILTAERVIEHLNLPRIDLFVVDEFYKVSSLRNDSRIDALNIAIMKILEHKPQSLFLTPCVNSLSDNFRKTYDVEFYQTDYSLVNTNIKEIRSNERVLNNHQKKSKLFDILSKLKEPSIVYVKSPNEGYKLADEYIKFLGENRVINKELPIFEWMDKNVSEKWNLKKFMMYGIGVHNGALPRHIVSSEVEMFNNGNLKILFATASLIEGVNTVAKNILIYSGKKGTQAIDFFDFSNIKGRAGRMGKYYTGNVYLFNEILESKEFSIDIPFIDQINISDEILFNIPNERVKNIERKKALSLNIPDDLQSIIKKNFIAIEGQKKLYQYIQLKKDSLDYLQWKGIPSYNQLWRTLYLAYQYLENEDNEKRSKGRAVMALNILNNPLKQAIKKYENHLGRSPRKQNEKTNIHDRAIEDVLKFIRNDANYKIPKLLAVVDSIQKYVYRENQIDQYGDYSIFCSQLENGKIGERFRFFIDYGLPYSAVQKLENKLKKELGNNITEKEIILWVKENFHSLSSNFLKYEYDLLKKSLNIEK